MSEVLQESKARMRPTFGRVSRASRLSDIGPKPKAASKRELNLTIRGKSGGVLLMTAPEAQNVCESATFVRFFRPRLRIKRQEYGTMYHSCAGNGDSESVLDGGIKTAERLHV